MGEAEVSTISAFGFYEPFSSWSHLSAAVFSIAGFVILMRRGRGNPMRLWSLGLYSFTLVFLFSMSGIFHLLDKPSDARDVLQRMDHAGIWTLIAGTFTPLHIILFRGPWRWVPLAVIWVLAITGLVLQIVFFTSFPEFLILGLFLGMGWFGFISMLKMKSLYYNDKSLWLLVAGGILYSVGAIIDFFRWPILWPGIIAQHELFHLFVILAAACHWYFIYKWSDHPVENVIHFSVRVFPGPSYHAKADGESIEFTATTMEELKFTAVKMVRARYHHTIEPKIKLRYFNEEYIS
jgi:channel protein (hemolysin III family)